MAVLAAWRMGRMHGKARLKFTVLFPYDSGEVRGDSDEQSQAARRAMIDNQLRPEAVTDGAVLGGDGGGRARGFRPVGGARASLMATARSSWARGAR